MKKSAIVNPIVFVFIILVWNWLGGYLLDHYNVDTNLIGLYFLAGTLIWSIIFTVVTKSSKEVGLARPIKFDWISLVLLILGMLIGALYLLLSALFEHDIPFNFDPTPQNISLLVFLPISLVLQAFCEEIAWTGWLYTNLKFKYVIKTLIIALVWIIWHIPFSLWGEQFYTYTALIYVLMVMQMIIARFVFNWFRKRMGNIWWPTFIHGGLNAAAFIIMLLFPGIETFGVTVIVSAIVTEVVLFSIQLFVDFRSTENPVSN